jgi:hypothetical protein
MPGDPEKLRAAYSLWVETNKESMELWLELAQGKRTFDQTVLQEMANKSQRLYTAFMEASSEFMSFPKF